MIGQTVWRFDSNHRVYTKPYPGCKWSGSVLIYREHWRPCVVVGETSRSWLVGIRLGGNAHWKVPKRGPHPGFALSEQEVDDDCWLNQHRLAISQAVLYLRDATKLRQIADIINWKPEHQAKPLAENKS